MARVELHGAAGDQRDRLAQQVVLERAQASRTSAASVAPGSSTARWAMIRPVSTPSSTKCTVTPKTFTP